MERESNYLAGLDGLRALAVIAVLAFHAQAPWMPGGFLGVSLFFTLSGFLITRLLLIEVDSTGTVDLLAFWGRRIRRLAPGAMLAIGFALLYLAVTDSATAAHLTDLRASLAYVANWRFLGAEATYGELFTKPSPVLHFWSLSIEEQYYLTYPIICFAILRGKDRVVRLTAALGVITCVSLALPAFFTATDRIYYGTDTRLAELTIGGLLACVAHGRGLQRLAPLGVAALGLTVGAWTTVGLDDGLLYHGGLGLYGLVSAGLVAGAASPGFLSRALAFKPLAHIGQISYGLYLYHWPIFVWIPEAPVVVRLAATFAAAEISFHLVEHPVRVRRVLAQPRPALVMLVVGMIVATLGVAYMPAGEQPATASVLREEIAPEVPPTTMAPETPPPPPEPVQIRLLGDSVAVALAPELTDIEEEFGAHIELGAIAAPDPESDLNILLLGADQPCDDTTSTSTEELFKGAFDVLTASEVPLVVVLAPPIDIVEGALTSGDPRVACINSILYRLVAQAPSVVTLDLGRWLCPGTPQVCQALRADGVRFTGEGADELGRWLIPAAMGIADVAPVRVPRIAVLGDSTGLVIADGLARYGAKSGELTVLNHAASGCPLVPVGEARAADQTLTLDHCRAWLAHVGENLAGFDPDLIVLASSAMETKDRRLDGGEWTSLADPAFAAQYQSEVASLVATLQAAAPDARIIILDAPPFQNINNQLSCPCADEEPARVAAYNTIITALAAVTPDSVEVLGFAAHLATLDASVRPDGVHFGEQSSYDLAETWLAPTLLAELTPPG